MAELKRANLYAKATTNNNTELDYLDTNIQYMELDTSTVFTIPEILEGRIDLISYIHYENPKYGWLILWANEIIDPTTELVSGMDIVIPSLLDYYNFYNANAKRRAK